MMNRYEELAKMLSDTLGQEYDIKYFDNEQVTWEDVVEKSFTMIRGVVGLSNSDSTKLGGILVDTCNVPVSFLIPVELFNEVIQRIESVMHDIHTSIYGWCSEYVQVNYNGRSDAEKIIVNGVDYGMTVVNLTLVCYTKAVLGNEAYIKLNNETLVGTSNIVYQCAHQQQGVVLGFNSPVQENRLSGISRTITVDMVLCKDDDLHIDLMENETTNKLYNVEFYNGFIKRNMKMSITALTEQIPMGNTIKAQLVLGIKEK